jgi:hypothetical protein
MQKGKKCLKGSFIEAKGFGIIYHKKKTCAYFFHVRLLKLQVYPKRTLGILLSCQNSPTSIQALKTSYNPNFQMID